MLKLKNFQKKKKKKLYIKTPLSIGYSMVSVDNDWIFLLAIIVNLIKKLLLIPLN